jgi:hypothetical protein
MLKVFFLVENSKPSHKTCTLIIKLQKNPKNKKHTQNSFNHLSQDYIYFLISQIEHTLNLLLLLLLF